MQLPILLLSTIETAINAWLKLDDEAMPQFASMQDKVIQFHITGLELNLFFLPAERHIQVLGQYAGKADTIIHGSPLALMRLSTSDDPGKTMLETDAHIEGDTGLGTRFSQVLKSVDIDWEEFLSKAVGDIVAHQAGSMVEESKGWIKDSEQAMRLNVAEYLTEESQLVAADAEVAHYMDQVDALRADTDRIQARIERLQNASNTSKNSTSDKK